MEGLPLSAKDVDETQIGKNTQFTNTKEDKKMHES